MERSFGKVVLLIVFLLSLSGRLQGEMRVPSKTPELLSLGKKLYEQNCITCHGPRGDGKGPLGPSLKPPPRDFNLPFKQWPYSKGDLKNVFEIISKGIANTSMVKWDHLPEKDRWALTYYVVEFSIPKTPAKRK